MEDDRSHMTERILSLTLEVICLLTGERCAVVKMAAIEGLLQGLYPPLSGDLNPITAPPPPSPTPQRNMEQKVLEVINQVAELLTGEVQRGGRSQLICPGEERIKEEEDDGRLAQELYEAAMMEEGSGKARQMSSGDSRQQMVDQSRSDSGTPVKAEGEGAPDGTYLSGNQWCVVEQSPAVGTDSCGGILTSPNSVLRWPDPRQGDDAGRGEGGFCCSLCDRRFRMEQTLERHSKTHSGGKCFGEKTQQSSRTEERPFSRSKCCRSFADKAKLAAHERSHAGRDVHSCAECGKWFAEKSKLLAYQPYHTEEEPYTCSQCGKTFVWISNPIKHQQQGRGQGQGQGHGRGQGQHQHIRLAMPPEKPPAILEQQSLGEEAHRKPLSCSTCERMFADKSQLIAHRRTHVSQKPHSCAECGESFVYKAELDVHVRSHTGQKVFSCLKCGNSYIFKSQLRKHWRIHSGEKRHPCSQCERSFIWKSELDLHMRRHRGEKPFPCAQCGKCFVLKSKLKQHEKTHSREKPFRCAECGRGFQYESQLSKHRDHHNAENPLPPPSVREGKTGRE